MTTYPLIDYGPGAIILGGNTTKDMLSSHLEHALRAPLAQISAPLELLKNADGSLSESERKHLYSIIGANASRMLELVHQLLLTQPAASAQAAAECPMDIPSGASENIGRRSSLLTPKGRRCALGDDGLLVKLFDLMEDNLEETDFTVHKMCSMVHMSHMHFIRKVKQLTGKKPIDLLKSFRLKRAKDLLRQNNLTVAEVAYKVGYDMPNSFSRAFKKEFGIRPSEYVG